MLVDAGGDFREVGKHGEVVELCSCMESVHVVAVVHCLLQHWAHGMHSQVNTICLPRRRVAAADATLGY
jgi:hypothetical protein